MTNGPLSYLILQQKSELQAGENIVNLHEKHFFLPLQFPKVIIAPSYDLLTY